MASPPNTPTLYYIDKQSREGVCKNEVDAVVKGCAPDEKNKDHRGLNKPKSRVAELSEKKKEAEEKGKKFSDPDAPWVLDHCGPLLLKPGEEFETWYADLESVKKHMNAVADHMQSAAVDKAQHVLLEAGKKELMKMAVRRGMTGWIPVVGLVLTLIDVGVTAIELGRKVQEMKSAVDELRKTVGNLKRQGKVITDSYSKYKNQLDNYKYLSDKAKKHLAREMMVDVQKAYAATNECLRARKCTLVPYSKGRTSKWSGRGCCPGQTGHHIMPDAMFRDQAKKPAAVEKWKKENKKPDGTVKKMSRGDFPTLDCWSEYDVDKAPTICAEGENQHTGSHGTIHTITDAKLQISGYLGKKEMPYTTARDLSISHISRLYGCSQKCLKSQLDAYYCKILNKNPECKSCDTGATVSPNSGMGGGTANDDDDTNNENADNGN